MQGTARLIVSTGVFRYKIMKKLLLSTLFLFSAVGCIYPTNFDSVKVNLGRPAGASSVAQDELSTKVVNSLSYCSKEQTIELYTQCKGLTEYLKRTTIVKTTGELFQLIGKVQEDLGWKRETCVGFTDLLESELKALAFDDNKTLDEPTKAQLVKFFDEVSLGCKLSVESK